MVAPRSQVEVGLVLNERYRLLSRIGTGVSARVFLAVDPRLQRRVAVKVLHEALATDDGFLRQFHTEIRAAASLAHQHIVKVLDSGEQNMGDVVVPYLVTEFLPGGSLRSILDAHRRLSASQALSVGRQAAEALVYAHQRGLVHRDIKPANLLFDEARSLRLADFGLARAMAEASWTEPVGTGAGATRYASPEQVTGARLDGRSDVYSLALVMIEAVTGSVPLLADTPAGTMGLRSGHEVDVPMEFGRLRGPLLRATALEPDERCDAGELVISLKAAQEDMDSPEPLPVVSTLGASELTGELRIHDGQAGLAVLGPLEGESARAEGAVRNDRYRDGRPGEPSVDPADRLVSDIGDECLIPDPIVVANDYEVVSTSRPTRLGVVDPLRGDVAPSVMGEGGESGTSRRRARLLTTLAVLAVVLGAAAAWWFLVRIPTHEVASFVGGDVSQVRSAAHENHWVLDDDTMVRQDDTSPGEVISQDPHPGSVLAEGDTMSVEVSLGPTLTPFPTVAGMSEADAKAAVAAAGLRSGKQARAFDEKVTAGSVISAAVTKGSPSPDVAGKVPKGTPVDLVISKGPAPRKVPDGLVNATKADAVAKLRAVQLKAGISEDYSDTVPAGVVVSAGNAAGAEVPRDSTVALVVSAGPKPIVVPNVVGQTGSAAAATLEQAGLVVSGIEGSPSGVVLATDPVAGEQRQKGTAVRLFTRR